LVHREKNARFSKKAVDREKSLGLYSRHVDALLRRRGLRFLSKDELVPDLALLGKKSVASLFGN